MRYFLSVLLLSLVIVGSTDARPFAEAVGFYTNGSIRHADALPLEGQGFMKLFVPRERNWAVRETNALIQDVARELAHAYPSGERVQIGDLSGQHGGFISGHGSHQNGLDIDIAYLRNNRREQSPDRTNGFDEDFVVNGRLSQNFDVERNWALLKLLVRPGNINRIFMDVEIKRALCTYAQTLGEEKTQAETLRRLRPWPKHSHHMHVRLKCPTGHSQCVAQTEVAPGSGCSAEELVSWENEL